MGRLRLSLASDRTLMQVVVSLKAGGRILVVVGNPVMHLRRMRRGVPSCGVRAGVFL